MQSERKLTSTRGLPGGPWYRHLLYAPGFYTGYGVKTMPACARSDRAAGLREKPSVKVVRVAEALMREAQLIDGLTRIWTRPEVTEAQVMSGSSRTLNYCCCCDCCARKAAFIYGDSADSRATRREGRRLIRPRCDRFVVRPRRQDRNVRRLDVRLAEEGASLLTIVRRGVHARSRR